MPTARALVRSVAAAVLALLGAGCGAGLIAGVAGSQGGGGAAEVRPPELSLSPVLPLMPVENSVRTVVVANLLVPTGSRLEVRLEAAGVAVAQPTVAVAGQGGSTSITFTLATAPIVAAAGDPKAADVAGRLRVLVDDRDVAPAAAVVLARQLEATLVLGGGATERFLSPFGERAEVRVRGLRHGDADNLQMLVATRDPTQLVEPGTAAPPIVRVCTGLVLLPTAAAGEAIVSAAVPGSQFPDRMELFVRDAVSGQSTSVTDVYYRPDVALALPSQGATTGGNLVTLIGTALVPHDFTVVPGPAPLSFAAVTLSFRKGGRVTALPREDFRTADSGRDRLVFAMPASPDGRPGQGDVVLRVQLEGVVAEVVESGLFLYANPDPFFGPRGAVVPQSPVAVAPIALDAAPAGDEAPDFAVLTEEGGVGCLQLLLAQENGMFQRFGSRRRIGDPGAAAERIPRDLCAGDFDGDGVPDMFIANEGAATAVHHLVLGQAKPETPLGAAHRIAGDPGTARCRIADFDHDGLPDVLLVPGPNAPAGLQPQVRLARPSGVGAPAFAPPVFVPVRPMRYEATEIADLDGDSFLDVAVVSGTAMQLDVAYGRGDGTFGPAVPLDLTIPGYAADPDSPAVGLHACADGPLQSLGLVIAGLPADPPGTGPTPPLIAVLVQSAPRTFTSPDVGSVTISPTNPLGVSLAADLDQGNTIELAIGVRGVPTVASVGMLRLQQNGFQPIPGGVETGAELPRNIAAMHFGRAFPATPLTGEAKAVFVVHESLVDGAIERRLSTRLLLGGDAQSLVLLPPDAGAFWSLDVEGIAGGNFRPISVAGTGSVRDLALGRAGGVDLLENDGFGGFPRPVGSLEAPGILPPTMLLLPAPAGQIDGLLFADATSRLLVWWPEAAGGPGQAPSAWSGELRLLAPAPRLRTAALAAGSRLQVADVDGDSVPDLVALLLFAVPSPGEGDALLALLRGKPDPRPDEFPFFAPAVATPVHGNATGFALGDFAAAGAGLTQRLELALAVPVGSSPGAIDGDHVRFYRYVAGATPEQDRFEASAAPGGPQVLLAGSAPTKVAAADFDRDGLVDLLVAAANDGTLRLYRNTAPVQGQQGHVAIAEFVESLSSPRQLPAGDVRSLRLGDVDGDGSIDVVTVVERRSTGGVRSTTVSYHLSAEPGVFADRRVVSPSRVGDRDAVLSLDLGDWNRDGLLDLFLAWNTHGPGDRNVRVLFGGSR
ncbi:MAG: VCBS repeat-containing protein [Planctomycetes bacterium]|nr:VCBS repeat-containing protein [Planctomycetota bacterium]